VLDAQWFGVAQRRRRVFVVGYLGDWQRPAKVLFESESVCRDTPPSREARKRIAVGVESGVADVCPTLGCELAKQVNNQMVNNAEAFYHAVAQPIGFGAQMSEPQTDMDLMQTLNAKNPMAVAFAQNQLGEVRVGEVTNTLNTNSNASGRNTPMVAQPIPIDTMNHIARGDNHSFGDFEPGAPSYTLTKGHSHAVAHMMQVRRLTPVECERLQGFPDNYTNIPWRKKPESPDGPRYKALGNSMAVPVMCWIGERIERCEQ
jgi:DNA (cytosine-5)-methyltransferase 1